MICLNSAPQISAASISKVFANVSLNSDCSYTVDFTFANVDVLLTVHLSTFILVINQVDTQNLLYNKFIS